MKIKLKFPALALLALLSSLNTQLSAVFAQGTAFTYQGRLNDSGSPANGSYDLRFVLYDNNVGGSQQGPILTNSATAVSNGLFAVTLDFGSQFPGASRWLEIATRTNGVAGFVTLSPRQKLTPTPYAITASNLSGTLPASQLAGSVGNTQLANSAITVNAGTGLTGGGTVALGDSITLNNTGVTSLAGGGGVTVSAASGAVTLGSTATSANTPNTIVSRDGSGNFAAGSVTLAGALNLPATTDTVYSGSAVLLHADSYEENFFAGQGAGNWPVTTGQANTAVGVNALKNDTNGGDNSALGDGALSGDISGYADTAVGAAAMSGNTNGNDNTAIGVFALGGFSSGNSGSYNTAEGVEALTSLTTGNDNTANGFGALILNTSGSANTADGYLTLYANTNGGYNVAVGYQALYNNSSGFNNTAVGENALYSYSGIGYNTAIGDSALQLLTSGNDNIALGDGAGYNITSGSWNIDIGNPGAASDTHTIKIGQQGTQSQTFIAGVSGTSVSGGAQVYVTSSGQLGSVNPAFVHTATSGNSTSAQTQIDNPLCNGKPNAILIVIPNGLAHPTGTLWVYYDSGTSRWFIEAQSSDLAPGMQFNVLVANP
ncbi:MAG TPA: hypothetical protein VMJ12_02795 [Candidatus Acidoferrales bacterium]|nr:hypothetical protein [Candidatus Acidoferrales bacterium]